MRYRTNLYREREARAARVRRGLARGTVLGIVVGLELLLVAFLVISGFQIRDRAEQVDASAAALETHVASAPTSKDLPAARALLQTRLTRVDWSSTLAAVAEVTPDNVYLFEITGGAGTRRGALYGLNLDGQVLGGARDLSPVFSYMESLRQQEGVSGHFPVIDLGTSQRQGRENFQITCRRNETGSAS